MWKINFPGIYIGRYIALSLTGSEGAVVQQARRKERLDELATKIAGQSYP